MEGNSHLFKPGDSRTIKAARKGGRSRRRKKTVRTVLPEDAPPPPMTLADCRAWLSWLAHAVSTGRVDSETARITTQALAELRRAIDAHEMEEKLNELRAQVKTLKAERKR